MTKSATHEEPTQEDALFRAQQRPLSAFVTCEAISKSTAGTDSKKVESWRLNSGAEMVTHVWGLNMGRDGYPQPVRVVLDLAKAKFEGAKIPCLYAHMSWSVIGNWTAPEIDNTGLYAEPKLYQPRNEIEAAVMPDAVLVNALMAQDHPWQCSVGCWPADGRDGYEAVAAGKTVSLNGRTYSGDGEYPLFVMRNPSIFEASIVLWGADSNTGKVAASLLNPVQHFNSRNLTPAIKASSPMETKPNLKALLEKHAGHKGLVAEMFASDKSEAEIDAAVHAAVTSSKDAEIKALKDEVTALKASAEKKPVVTATSEAPKGPTFSESGDDANGPKTLTEAMNLVWASDKTLKGQALRAAALKKFPNVEKR